MNAGDWKVVHDRARFDEELARADRDPENGGFLLGALARRALEEWELEPAEAAIARMPGATRDRCDLWAALAARYLELDETTRARGFLEKARALTNDLEKSWQRGDALAAVAVLLRRAGDRPGALKAWEEAFTHTRSTLADDPGNACKVLSEIAEGLAVAGALDRAAEVAAAIPEAGKQLRARQRVEALQRTAAQRGH